MDHDANDYLGISKAPGCSHLESLVTAFTEREALSDV